MRNGNKNVIRRENEDQAVADRRLFNTRAMRGDAAQRRKANIVFASGLTPRERYLNCDFQKKKRAFCTEVLYAPKAWRKTGVEPKFFDHPLLRKT